MKDTPLTEFKRTIVALRRAEECGKRTSSIAGGGGKRIRWLILQHLYAHPLCGLTELSHALMLSRERIRYHLRTYLVTRLVKIMALSRGQVYFPANFFEDSEIRILSLFSSPLITDVFYHIRKKPGASASELCLQFEGRMSYRKIRLAIKTLLNSGAVRAISDGKHRRYYPSEIVVAAHGARQRRAEQIAALVVNNFSSNDIETKILKKRKSLLVLQLPAENVVLNLPLNPFERLI